MAELFKVTEGVICQQCNCQGAYGAGLSGAIADAYPKVRQDFQELNKGIPNALERLGKILKTKVSEDGEKELYVASIFGQLHYGNSARTGIKYTDTNVLVASIDCIAATFSKLPVYLPHSIDKWGNHNGIGCGLAGEKWAVLYPLIYKLTERHDNLYLLDTFTGETLKVADNPPSKFFKKG